jgi:hypothetical protein
MIANFEPFPYCPQFWTKNDSDSKMSIIGHDVYQETSLEIPFRNNVVSVISRGDYNILYKNVSTPP